MPKIDGDPRPPGQIGSGREPYTGPAPTIEHLEDCVRRTLQEWFQGYMPGEDEADQVPAGANPLLGRWLAVQVGDFGAGLLVRVAPVTEDGVDPDKGALFRIHVVVERVTEL